MIMTLNTSLPIGVFDSGMGGLTVLRELIRELPHESFLYLGDTARLPYGTKSQITVLRYASAMAELLVERGIKLLVIACNTATAAALPHLQKQFPRLPIVGVVEPGVRAALQATSTEQIALLATESTINSGIYQSTIQALNPCIQLITQPAGLLVALAEEGFAEDSIGALVVKKYLAPIIERSIHCDTLILGCTHFPVFLKVIQEHVSDKITVVNSAEATAKVVVYQLKKLELNSNCNVQPTHHYLVTDLPDRFCRLAKIFSGYDIHSSSVELVDHQELAVESNSGILNDG